MLSTSLIVLGIRSPWYVTIAKDVMRVVLIIVLIPVLLPLLPPSTIYKFQFFNENPYFTDSVLWKVYEDNAEGYKVHGSGVNWKPGKVCLRSLLPHFFFFLSFYSHTKVTISRHCQLSRVRRRERREPWKKSPSSIGSKRIQL
jgi:hypothetical protein